LAERIAGALSGSQRPLVVSGLECGSQSVLNAAANITRALQQNGKPAHIALTVPECNSLGLALLSPRPLEDAFNSVRDRNEDVVLVLENDLYRRVSAADVDGFFRSAEHVIALDHLQNRTTAMAELNIPAATFAESDGTLINNEGRAQRFFQVFVPESDIQESWRWLRDIFVSAGRREFEAWKTLDDVVRTLATEIPELVRVADAAPPADFRMAGDKIPREPHRYSGRTAMNAHTNVSEPKPPHDPDSALSFSMEGNPDQPPSALISFAWSPGWNSYQAWNKFQEEIAGPLRGGNPGVRLFETRTEENKYYENIPAESRPNDGELLIVSLYHVFGSEELSIHSPGVKQLSPGPYIAINDGEARQRGLELNSMVEFALGGANYRAPLQIRPDLPAGLAGIPAGINPFHGVLLPAWSKVVRAS
ncbi:MAG TPA: molybdopterin-dependent oxidoreductase, partial [Bryobacteraceae bacterium]|nr:molybdopterin-dependent oxidoreductase [Bryobacteraceae bacterium]